MYGADRECNHNRGVVVSTTQGYVELRIVCHDERKDFRRCFRRKYCREQSIALCSNQPVFRVEVIVFYHCCFIARSNRSKWLTLSHCCLMIVCERFEIAWKFANLEFVLRNFYCVGEPQVSSKQMYIFSVYIVHVRLSTRRDGYSLSQF